MDDRLTEKKPQSTVTLSKIFREAFPHYLVMGMSAEEYWDGEPWLVKPYREAYRIRMENQDRIADRDAWRMGEYIRHALVSVPITVTGWAPKGHRLQDYPEKPMTTQAEERKQEENEKKKQDNQQQLALAMFQAFTEKMNKGIRKRLEQEKSGKP